MSFSNPILAIISQMLNLYPLPSSGINCDLFRFISLPWVQTQPARFASKCSTWYLDLLLAVILDNRIFVAKFLSWKKQKNNFEYFFPKIQFHLIIFTRVASVVNFSWRFFFSTLEWNGSRAWRELNGRSCACRLSNLVDCHVVFNIGTRPIFLKWKLHTNYTLTVSHQARIGTWTWQFNFNAVGDGNGSLEDRTRNLALHFLASDSSWLICIGYAISFSSLALCKPIDGCGCQPIIFSSTGNS